MHFETPGEKIKQIRKLLNIRQNDLEQIGVTRNFISLVEGNKRRLGEEQASQMYEIFLSKAKELGITLDLDHSFLSISPKEAAQSYCSEMLLKELSLEEIGYILTLAKEYGLTFIEAEARILKANKLYDKWQYKEAFIEYYDALDIYIEAKKYEKRAFLFNKLGKCKGITLDYLEALMYFEKSYQYALETEDIYSKNNSLFNIAICHTKLGSLEEALKCIAQVLEIFDKENNFENYVNMIILKANCLRLKKEDDKAAELYDEVIPLFKDETHPVLGNIYHNLGNIYFDKDMLEEALKSYNRAITIRELSSPDKLSRTQLEKAKVFVRFKMYDQAIILTKGAVEIAKQYNDIQYILEGYYQLESIYRETNKIVLLEQVYLSQINLLEEINKRDEVVKVYVKLSLLNSSNNKMHLEYLEKAVSA